jgi:hypothetical protein
MTLLCRLLFLFFASAIATLARPDLAERPNVILLMGDDHGWGETGYVLPLAAETNVLTKSRIGSKEFEEWELRPADPDSLAERFLNAVRPDAGFRAVENPQHDPAMPWAEPPLLLTGELYSAGDGSGPRESVTLRPMGSTLLRRAAFPATQTQKVR